MKKKLRESSIMEIQNITADQMVEVDRVMIEEYGIELIQMMENAGRNLAHLARIRFLDGDPRGREVIVLAGSGGNGGGALVAARRLHNWGARISVATTRPPHTLSGVPARQAEIVTKMGIQMITADSLDHLTHFDLIIDGIIGYSLAGVPTGNAALMIEWANRSGIDIVSLDVPSGMDASAGVIHSPVIRATATLTLALPKTGLQSGDFGQYTGEIYLADISVPPELYGKLPGDLSVGPLFAEDDILRIC